LSSIWTEGVSAVIDQFAIRMYGSGVGLGWNQQAIVGGRFAVRAI